MLFPKRLEIKQKPASWTYDMLSYIWDGDRGLVAGYKYCYCCMVFDIGRALERQRSTLE